MSKSESATLALVNGDLVVGWSGFGPARDEDCDPNLVTELYGIYLLSEYWGMGHGKQLLEATETRIRQGSTQSLVLWVFEKNTRARKFYEAFGYRSESESPKQSRVAGAAAMQLRFRKLLDETASMH